MNIIRIATRQSPLALWQAEHVKARLQAAHAGLRCELVTFTTQGDKILDAPLAKIGGKGLFVKELENALLDGRADLAVHSMKDVPVDFPDGLGMVAIGEREDPSDAFVSNHIAHFNELPKGAIVGTSSLRRRCQLLALRPDLDIRDLRGNVGTRLSKLDNGDYAAIVLASAGLKRLGLASRIRHSIDIQCSLPAVGQGALGIETRLNDAQTRAMVAVLHHAETAECVRAERALNARLQGGCQVPIAAFAVTQNGRLFLQGRVGSVDGLQLLKAEAVGEDAETLGHAVAEQLLAQGADKILQAVYGR